ncbi:MAG: 16S rRNA (guanine(966)-N(2))-methyltransferase RsmD [Pseudomonadota bacterium]|mgnify:CR=1 FL=1|nr:16S rRNA (guanine(966)-N(2))-methyltransferase RsmD [Pseudomonadota bacterium]
MRIISGKFKGRRLSSFSASHIRPTTDRVKESLFNIIAADLPEAKVLDLFSGTGNLGIEALSRGAEQVTFVEIHKKSLTIIRENLKLFEITGQVTILGMDVFAFLKDYSGEPFEVILIDPPFTKAIGHDVMLALCESKAIKIDTVVALETAKKERIETKYGNLIGQTQRNYGDKVLSVFRS